MKVVEHFPVCSRRILGGVQVPCSNNKYITPKIFPRAIVTHLYTPHSSQVRTSYMIHI